MKKARDVRARRLRVCVLCVRACTQTVVISAGQRRKRLFPLWRQREREEKKVTMCKRETHDARRKKQIFCEEHRAFSDRISFSPH